jgi:hypothetical protein
MGEARLREAAKGPFTFGPIMTPGRLLEQMAEYEGEGGLSDIFSWQIWWMDDDGREWGASASSRTRGEPEPDPLMEMFVLAQLRVQYDLWCFDEELG